MKTLLPALALLAAALASPAVVTGQIIQVKKQTNIDLGQKKSAPKQRRPKPKPAPASTSAPKPEPPKAEAKQPAKAEAKQTPKAEAKQPTKAVPTKAAPAKAEAKQPVLDVAELKSAKLYGYLYDGRFERLEKDDIQFNVLLASYVKSFSDYCQASLPPDKEELTKVVESYDTQMHYLYSRRGLVGAYTTQSLADRRVVGTGIFATPQFAAAFRSATYDLNQMIARNFLGGLTQGKIEIYPEEFLKAALELPEETRLLLNRNGCDGAATKRFGENLLRFANGQPSLQQQNGEPSFFEQECRRRLPGIFAGAGEGACKCVHGEFKKALGKKDFLNLEDRFDPENFLLTSFSQVGLRQKVSNCLAR